MPRDASLSTQDSALSTQHFVAVAVATLAALVYVNALWNGLVWDDPIVTEVVPPEKFWPAEPYHQNYFANNPGNPYCAAVIAPSV